MITFANVIGQKSVQPLVTGLEIEERQFGNFRETCQLQHTSLLSVPKQQPFAVRDQSASILECLAPGTPSSWQVV